MELLEQIREALSERYRVERELGQGGMAVVYLAEDLKHHRRVAIKVLKPELSAVIGGERFTREIEIAAALQHPHILPLFDSGQAQGLSYFVMPFAEGESLAQRLARERQLPIDVALQITREIGSALQYAHEHGVIHRDIKPENVMLTGGQAVVTDFGIARAVQAAGEAQLTQTGMVVGTPQYMSPEQSGGDVVDARSDQYSMACTLYEMLAGHPPFTGASSQAVIARHATDPVPSLRVVRQTVPPVVEAAIVRAMAKVPADRFPSVQHFLDALDTTRTASLQLAGTERGFAPNSRRRRIQIAALGMGVLLVAAVAAWKSGWWKAGSPPASAHVVRGVAVLPFQDFASNADSSYLGPGMTDGLISDLAQVGSLKVISASSGLQAQGASLSLADLARQLGIDAVVQGSIRRIGDSVHVHARLLRAADSTVLYSGDYAGRLGQLPDLQREITVAITSSINAELKAPERSRLTARREVDQRAYDAYLRGRFHLERGELERAKTMFEQAEKIAPDWAPPYVGMANYYTSLPFFTDTAPAAVLPKARAALARSLELDETLAEAHAVNGYIRAYYEWDWRSAEREFRRALELRPNYADGYFSYSRFLASRHRLDEAIVQLGHATELDPLSLPLQANRALLDYFAGRYDQAAGRLRDILKSDSTDITARWGLALVSEQIGKPAVSIALLLPLTSSLNRKSSLGHAYAVAGNTLKARSILAALRSAAVDAYVPAYYFAVVHAGLGEKDQALRYLERAYDERSTVLAYLLIDPRLSSLRDEPRFAALARRLAGD